MRTLLDQLVQQAREANGGGAAADASGAATGVVRTDAAALFEDATGMRLMLARTPQERQTWQRELAGARQRLAAVEPRMQPAANARTQPAANQPAIARAASPITSPRETAPAARNAEPISPPPAANTTPGEATGRVVNASSPINAARGSAANASPLEVGSLVERATQRVAPSYPPSARSARVGGVVTVYVVVNERGNVEDVSRAAGPQLLRRAAEDAVRRWRFRPTLIDGQPTRVAGFVSFNFAL